MFAVLKNFKINSEWVQIKVSNNYHNKWEYLMK